MTGVLIVTYIFSLFFTPQDEKEEKDEQNTKTVDIHKLHVEFNKFRHKYIFVYLIIMLADWMQVCAHVEFILSRQTNTFVYLTIMLADCTGHTHVYAILIVQREHFRTVSHWVSLWGGLCALSWNGSGQVRT